MHDIKPLSPILPLGNNVQNTNQQSGVDQARSIVQGKVESSLGDNIFLVRVGSKSFQVHSPTPLNIGQQVRLNLPTNQAPQAQILSTGSPTTATTPPATTLPAPEQTQLAGAGNLLPLLNLITSNSASSTTSIDLSGLFTAMLSSQNSQAGISSETLSTLSLFHSLQQNFLKNPTEAGKTLQNLVSLLGLNHDKKASAGLATKTTLKNSLLELLSSKDGNSPIHNEASKNIERLVFSQLSQLGASLQDETVIPIPLPFIEKGFLQIQDVVDDSLHFSLNVQMSKLGNLNFSFAGNPQAIYLSIFTEKESISDLFTPHLETLSRTLSTFLPIAGVRVEEGAEDISTKLLHIVTNNSSSSFIQTTA